VDEEKLLEIDIEKIQMNPSQPRRQFCLEELQELAQSIKSVGIIHPPSVRPVENGYELIAGERRYRAAIMAGYKKIPVVVKNGTTQLSAQAALIENVQRVDLNPIEVAQALRSLVEQYSCQQNELAEWVGKKRSTIANYLRLLGLPKSIQESVRNQVITMGHAKAILSLETSEQQTLLYHRILRDQMTVREAEQAALRLSEKVQTKRVSYQQADFYLEQLAEKIQGKLGTKVAIQGKGKGGRIAIDYHDLDDLDRLLQIFGVEVDI
jgi:ParB family chromosome partitioning protein